MPTTAPATLTLQPRTVARVLGEPVEVHSHRWRPIVEGDAELVAVLPDVRQVDR